MKTERIGVVALTTNIRNCLNDALGREEILRAALLAIANYPTTTTEGSTSDHMRLIAHKALQDAEGL